MKQSIKWYEDCLRNRRKSIARDKKLMNDLNHRIRRSEVGAEKLQMQITVAKEQGRDGFDEERFMKDRL